MNFKLLTKLSFLILFLSNTVLYAAEGFSYTVLYTGVDNDSHFKRGTDPLYPKKVGATTLPLHVKEAVFGIAPAGVQTWHNSPRRMYIIVLSGVMQIQTSNAQLRNFKAGDVLLAEDCTGKGHITRGLNGEPVSYLSINL